MESRGMKIEDRKWAIPRLKRIGYYRLCAYARPLQQKGENSKDHTYKKNVSFGLLLKLYEFDQKLRSLVFDAIEPIEIAARACISDRMSLTNGPHWFLDDSHFASATYAATLRRKIESEFLDDAGKPKRQNSDFVLHYYQTYGDPYLPPSWMIAEALSLGTWSQIYEALKPTHQKAITSILGIDYQDFQSWLRSISAVRNICAHHGRLWNRVLPTVRLTSEMTAAGTAPNRFATQAAVLEHLLRKLSPGRHLAPAIASLLATTPEVDPHALGFPKDWTTHEYWKFGETTPDDGPSHQTTEVPASSAPTRNSDAAPGTSASSA